MHSHSMQPSLMLTLCSCRQQAGQDLTVSELRGLRDLALLTCKLISELDEKATDHKVRQTQLSMCHVSQARCRACDNAVLPALLLSGEVVFILHAARSEICRRHVGRRSP